uniref:Ig-like domain-containing protein n=1 Tax=Spermophilus dauricus TaxID=99837 RepID=A0A8C9QVE7_SPEDA
MQPPSASPCRGGISWQGVLLAVSLLTFWNPHPTAQLTIEPVPFDAAEGRDVLLLVHNVSGNTVGVSWYRGQITDRSRLIVSYSNITHSAAQGPAFSGREIVYPNGSLLFVNLTKEDTGFYTLQTTTKLCASPTHSPGGPTSSDPSDPPASAQDTHSAFCGDHRAILSVVCTEKLPKPNITINNSQPMEGEDSLALTCEPEISYATYLWKINSQRIPDGDRLKLSNNNRTLTLFSVTRNDTGPYECETQNPVSASRLVAQPSLRATNTEPHSVAMTCFSDDPGISITWILNSQTLQLTDRMQLSPDHRTLSIDPVRQEDAGEYQCEASNPASSTRSDRYRLAVICEWPPSHPVLPSHISLSRAIIWHQP